jgi:uncharacterized protein (DUF433 family)
LAVEHILEMLDAGDTTEEILEGYDWLEPEGIEACLVVTNRPTNTVRFSRTSRYAI